MISDELKSISSLLHRKPTKETVRQIPLSDVDPDPKQPRKHFDEESLQELARSIEQYGVLQPIGVREINDDRYLIVFGERRFRASKLARGVESIPALIVDGADSTVQMIENIQRHDLEPHEISEWIQARLENGETSASIARRLGKSKEYVSLYKSFASMPDYLHFLYKRGDCTSIKSLVSLHRLGKDYEKEVKDFCDQADGPVSQRKVQEFLNHVKSTEPQDKVQTEGADVAREQPEIPIEIALPKRIKKGVVVRVEGSDVVGFLDLKTTSSDGYVRVFVEDTVQLFDKDSIRVYDIIA